MSNYLINDGISSFDNLFQTYSSGTKVANTGFLNDSGIDIANLYQPSDGYNSISKTPTNFKLESGSDLSDLFQPKLQTNQVEYLNRNFFAIPNNPNNVLNNSALTSTIDLSGNIYVGGSFTSINSTAGFNLLPKITYDSVNMSYSYTKFISITGTNVNSLEVDNLNNMYISGAYTSISDGTNTSTFTTNGFMKYKINTNKIEYINQPNNTVTDIKALDSSNVFVCGTFTQCGYSGTNSSAISTKLVAKYNGSNWVSLGSGITTGTQCNCIEIDKSNNDVYFAGAFTVVNNNVSVNNVAKWNITTNTWSALGYNITNNPSAQILAMKYFNNQVFVSHGAFIKKYDINNNTWTIINDQANATIYTLEIDPYANTLYVGGNFTTFNNDTSIDYIAQTNISTINWIGNLNNILTINNYINDIKILNNQMIISGNFTGIFGDTYYNKIGYLHNLSEFNSTNPNINNIIYVDSASSMDTNILIDNSNNIYLSLRNLKIKNFTVNPLLKWNGNSWMNVGTYTSPITYGICIFQNILYAISSGPIIKWNGTSWISVGNANATISTIYSDNNYLYIGGSFTSVGITTPNITANYIARYNGTNWYPMGSGFTDTVISINGDGTYIYAGGFFIQSGTTTVNKIARWNNTNWEAMGSGITGSRVNCIKYINNNLYIAGGFSSVNGITTSNIARWNTIDNNWYSVGTSEIFNNSINTFDINNTDIYVGGIFTKIGTLNTRLAKFDGTRWSNVPNLSNLINNNVYNMVIKNNILYVVGKFYNTIYKYRLA